MYEVRNEGGREGREGGRDAGKRERERERHRERQPPTPSHPPSHDRPHHSKLPPPTESILLLPDVPGLRVPPSSHGGPDVGRLSPLHSVGEDGPDPERPAVVYI